MTEQDWLTSSDPVLLMCGLQNRISQRKCDLFDLACAEGVSAAWPDPFCREYHSYMSRVVEGYDPPDDEFDQLRDAIDELVRSTWDNAQSRFDERGSLDQTVIEAVRRYDAVALLSSVQVSMEWWFWLNSIELVAIPTTPQEAADAIQLGTYRDHLPLLRCIVGNPFRPVTCNPSWRTSTAVSLAEAIYAERAFDRLPILADALEEAGCTQPDVLTHCRGDGPHARGCWVVDLILGKA
jgi:hypothetical protein